MSENKEGKPLRYDSGLKSHRIYLPFVILILVIYMIYLIIVTPSNTDLIPILTGSMIQDFFVILLLIPIIGLLLVFLAPLIAMVYFKLYKIIFRYKRLSREKMRSRNRRNP